MMELVKVDKYSPSFPKIDWILHMNLPSLFITSRYNAHCVLKCLQILCKGQACKEFLVLEKLEGFCNCNF
jgi:hypothetical protein